MWPKLPRQAANIGTKLTNDPMLTKDPKGRQKKASGKSTSSFAIFTPWFNEAKQYFVALGVRLIRRLDRKIWTQGCIQPLTSDVSLP
jgi:predicted YcjX-like family ATPase